MALLIKKEGLKTTSGINIPIADNPNGGVFVKFDFKSFFEGYNQLFNYQFFSSYSSKEEKLQQVQIMDGDVIIPNQMIKEMTQEKMAEYRVLIDQMFPGYTWDIKIILAYHVMIKELLEEILGKDTVEIRPDLS